MIKGVILTHGDLAESLVKTVNMIMGEHVELYSIPFNFEEGIELFEKRFEEFIMKNQDEEIVIFTDLFGGSCLATARKYLDRKNVHVITNVNLSELIYFSSMKDKLPVKKLINGIVKSGKQVFEVSKRNFRGI
ncbi:MAG: hypothetical protein FXF47_09325 [Candidatus Mcinerneyibacterium aminivorans]|jgi:mannose/fructose-specific phosphotransferase system component IIA|uniref:PTS EIIA type-4 domain-containing protein n=1 Tax=Candidatus Mcinerneyibacterium aminivorans TaxID=2703815 RepID=A0A5D0MDJ6_9BACT|nr:MAG: hypothetical protein FXF47_09325 [Candidatus Mcinerneyibacterium aminivorans]